MAQAATMGPPLSPREIRRSGRRSAPSASTSTSKSPDSDLPPKQKETTQRPTQPSSGPGRNKRVKDDPEEHSDDRKNAAATAHPPTATTTTTTTTSATSAGGKGKRKNNREKDKNRLSIDVSAETLQEPPDDKSTEAVDEEEQGVTRCVCGSTGEDEADAGEFMVQCETCKVWQHGLCMGFDSEDQVHDADYYCEQCRPELHGELLKKLAKKARQSSTVSHGPTTSRVSRSHSPAHVFKRPSGRRNTMNSRDAAFDESLKEIIEATAAEAAAAQENAVQPPPQPPQTNGAQPEAEEDVEVGSNNKKKRKRTEDDAPSKKRTRSASSASDQQPPPIPRPPTPPLKAPAPSTAPPVKGNARTKRNSRKIVPAADTPAPLDGDDTTQSAATTTTKRQGGSARSKGPGGAKRPPISHSNSHGNSTMGHEQTTSRRGQSNNTNGQGNSALESSRAYRNSHAYAVSQQPLFTSWGLPDYLTHLEEMLPTVTPKPLEIQSGVGAAASAAGRESMERTMERGVKVKWPSKRMSVVDMNKRVRALVEWVGREQANALDRERRREALEASLKLELELSGKEGAILGDEAAMAVDGVSAAPVASQASAQSKPVAESEHDSSRAVTSSLWKTADGKPMSTMKMMEELMEELIGFQERFGPGAKVRERERRLAITS